MDVAQPLVGCSNHVGGGPQLKLHDVSSYLLPLVLRPSLAKKWMAKFCSGFVKKLGAMVSQLALDALHMDPAKAVQPPPLMSYLSCCVEDGFIHQTLLRTGDPLTNYQTTIIVRISPR